MIETFAGIYGWTTGSDFGIAAEMNRIRLNWKRGDIVSLSLQVNFAFRIQRSADSYLII